jgi:hypothetical protein
MLIVIAHADRDHVTLEGAGEIVAGELAALVDIEDLGPAAARQRVLEGFEQNSAPSVSDSRHASTARLTQSMITTR